MVKEIRPVTGSIETVNAAAEPVVRSASAEAFYARALRELAKLDLPFLLAGTYALSAYTGVTRATKDLDIVCKPADYPRVLNHFRNLGYTVAIEDERWLGKVFQDEHFFDVIFAFWHGMAPVADQWFESAPHIKVFGTQMRIIAPTELIWSKALRPDAAPLRRCGYRASHSQATRSDRLAASACLHGVALGGTPGTSTQLPLGLPERARLRAALADGRTGRPPEDPVRASSSAGEDMSGAPVFAGRL